MFTDILIKAKGILRMGCWFIDQIGFWFIDDGYDSMITIMEGFNGDSIHLITDSIIKNCYFLVGIFAFFRIAIMLIQSIIDPDKLTDSKAGLSKYFTNFVIAIGLLVVVPIAFDYSRTIQKKIVSDNQVIPNLIFGSDLKNDNASDALQLIAMKALLHPDDRLATRADGQYTANSSCTGNCALSVQAWNENRLRFSTVEKFIGEYSKVGDGEYVFYYSYVPFLNLVVGLFMTYVLLSFTIDIGIRSVELLALEILSPFFIVTYVDPKMAKSGAFHNWLKACFKSYGSLFIRIAIISFMLLMLSNYQNIKSSNTTNPIMDLVLILCILIFAKKAPKWISDLIGLEDGAGVGGLWSASKIKDNALGGAQAVGAIAAGHALVKNHQQKHALEKEEKAKRKAELEKAGNNRAMRKEINSRYRKGKFARNAAAAKSAFEAFNKGKNANTFSDYKNAVNETAQKFGDEHSLKDAKIGVTGVVAARIEDEKNKYKEYAWGNAQTQLDRQKAFAKAEKRGKFYNEKISKDNEKATTFDMDEIRLSKPTSFPEYLAQCYCKNHPEVDFNTIKDKPADVEKYSQKFSSSLTPEGFAAAQNTFNQYAEGVFDNKEANANEMASIIKQLNEINNAKATILHGENTATGTFDISEKGAQRIADSVDENIKDNNKNTNKTSTENVTNTNSNQGSTTNIYNTNNVTSNTSISNGGSKDSLYAMEKELKEKLNKLANLENNFEELSKDVTKKYSQSANGILECDENLNVLCEKMSDSEIKAFLREKSEKSQKSVDSFNKDK